MVKALTLIIPNINQCYKKKLYSFSFPARTTSRTLLYFFKKEGIIDAFYYFVDGKNVLRIMVHLGNYHNKNYNQGLNFKPSIYIQQVVNVTRPIYVKWKKIELNYAHAVNIYVFSTTKGLKTAQECVHLKIGGLLYFIIKL